MLLVMNRAAKILSGWASPICDSNTFGFPPLRAIGDHVDDVGMRIDKEGALCGDA